MKNKINIDNLKINQEVLITSFNPPEKAKIMDMYELPSTMVYDERIRRRYPNMVPMVEVIMHESGRLNAFVSDVVKPA